MRFAVGPSRGEGEYSWWLYGDNGTMVAWAGETFPGAPYADRAARGFKAGAYAARYEIYEDGDVGWRWIAWWDNDMAASSGEAFQSSAKAELAAQNVRLNAGQAQGL